MTDPILSCTAESTLDSSFGIILILGLTFALGLILGAALDRFYLSMRFHRYNHHCHYCCRSKFHAVIRQHYAQSNVATMVTTAADDENDQNDKDQVQKSSPDGDEDEHDAGDDNNDLKTKHAPCPLDVCASNIGRFQQGSFGLLVQEIFQTLPRHVAEYAVALLVARGTYKAFCMREELINYKKVLVHYQKSYEQTEKSLRRLVSVFHRDEGGLAQQPQQRHNGQPSERVEVDSKAILASIQLHRQLSTIRGSLAIIRDVRTWTKQICCVPRWCPGMQIISHSSASPLSASDAAAAIVLPTTTKRERLFIAGDACIYKQPAKGLAIQDMLHNFQSTENLYTEQMRQLVHQQGQTWPIPVAASTSKGAATWCALCGACVGKAWMTQNSVCWKCADDIKSSHRCPYEKGHPSYLCPHRGLCFSCQGHSCLEQCRIIRGGGEIVTEMIQWGMPHKTQNGVVGDATTTKVPFSFVFMDFDQTLASTKTGGPPHTTRHGCNPHLLQILKNSTTRQAKTTKMNTSSTTLDSSQVLSCPEVHIVTRQNHTRRDQILAFLSAFSVSLPSSHIHCLGGTKTSKAEVIQAVMNRRVVMDEKGSESPAIVMGSQNHENCANVDGDEKPVAALFVDDSAAEVCHPDIRRMINVLSVLFISKDFSSRAKSSNHHN